MLSELEMLRARVVALEQALDELARRFRYHARDSLGRASLDQPHPVQIVDQIEVTARMRLGVGGIYIAGTAADQYRTYYVPQLQATAVDRQWPRAFHGGSINLAVGSREARYEINAEQSEQHRVSLALVARETGSPSVTISPGLVRLTPLQQDPSPLEDGMIWFRGDLGELRVHVGGVTRSVQLL